MTAIWGPTAICLAVGPGGRTVLLQRARLRTAAKGEVSSMDTQAQLARTQGRRSFGSRQNKRTQFHLAYWSQDPAPVQQAEPKDPAAVEVAIHLALAYRQSPKSVQPFGAQDNTWAFRHDGRRLVRRRRTLRRQSWGGPRTRQGPSRLHKAGTDPTAICHAKPAPNRRSRLWRAKANPWFSVMSRQGCTPTETIARIPQGA